MRRAVLFFVGALAAFGQATGVTVVQERQLQIVVAYTAPSGSACTVKLATDSGHTALVNDVNATLYTDADQDLSRTTTVTNGLARMVVFGSNVNHYPVALDGSKRSRVLQANTHYYGQIICGSAVNFEADTLNIPLGQVASSQTIAVSAPFTYDAPSLNPFYQTSFVDASTGLLVHEYPGAFGASYAGSTGASGVAFGCVENLTSGWSATSGTLTSATATDDNIYAQTSTTGSKLFLGLCDSNYSKYPTDSTFDSNALSFQNLILRVDCTGCGAGVAVKVALTTDRGTLIQTKTITATTTEQQIVMCQDAPCTTQANPGDWWSPDQLPRDRFSIGLGYIYTSGADTTLHFLNSTDCADRRVGDLLKWWDQGQGASYSAHITATSCPTVTLDATVHADGNGTSGIPFTYASGIANNSQYGFLVWSDADLTGITLRIDQAMWRAASYIGGPAQDTCATGSGGFNKRIQKPKTTNGFNLCAAGHNIWAFKPQSDGTLDMRFLGVAVVRPDLSGQTNAVTDPIYIDNGTSDFMWDDTTAGVFYATFSQTFTSPASGTAARAVGRFVLSAPETAVTSDPETNRTPRIAVDATASKTLTACLNSCTSASTDDYTIAGQALRIDPGRDFTRWRVPDLNAVQDGYLKMTTREGDQDTFGQSFMFDVGNGSPIGAGYAPTATHPTVGGHNLADQQIFAFDPTYATAGMRWGGDHTQQPVLYSNAYTLDEAGEKNPYTFIIGDNVTSCTKGVNCGACPDLTLDGVTYSSTSGAGGNVYQSCIHVTSVSSTWPGGACGATPDPNFVSGDPVNSLAAGNPNYCWLQHLQAGDLFQTHGSGNTEFFKVVVYNSASDLVVERACNSQVGGSYPPNNWGAGATYYTMSNAYPPDCSIARTEQGSGAQQWDFIRDPLASNSLYTHFSTYQNHAFNVCNGTSAYRLNPDYIVQKVDCTDATALGSMTPHSTISLPLTFGSVSTTGPGDSVEKHPSAVNTYSSTAANRTTFFDSNPFEFYFSGSAGQHALVSGKTNTYKLGPGTGDAFHPKLFPMGAFSGQPPYLNISSPSATLGDTTADRGKICIVVASDGCGITGSVAGEVYANGPLDPLELYCRAIEFWSGQLDTCLGDAPNFAGADNQWMFPTDNTSTLSTNHFRSLSRHLSYRLNATDNVKTNPDGDFMFFRNDPWYANLPPVPSNDSVDRTTFDTTSVQVPIVGASLPGGTSRVLVKFGYDESFNCSENEADPCYAYATSVTTSNPFLWGAELTNTSGVAAGDATIPIPIVDERRAVSYSVIPRDSSGVVLGTPTTVFPTLLPNSVAPTITTSCPLPSGTEGSFYTVTLTASGDTPITWTDSPLPAGLTLSGATISGTPTTAGTTTGTLQASNSVGNSTNGPLSCAITINASASQPGGHIRHGKGRGGSIFR